MSEAEVTRDPERWHRRVSLGVTLTWMVVLMLLGRSFSTALVLLLPMALIWSPQGHPAPTSLNGAFFSVLSRTSLRILAWALLIGLGILLSISSSEVSYTSTVTKP